MLRALGLIIAAGIVAAIVISFITFFLWLAMLFIGVFVIAWLCGLPITVRSNGEVIGYWKRWTFYPASQWKSMGGRTWL